MEGSLLMRQSPVDSDPCGFVSQRDRMHSLLLAPTVGFNTAFLVVEYSFPLCISRIKVGRNLFLKMNEVKVGLKNFPDKCVLTCIFATCNVWPASVSIYSITECCFVAVREFFLCICFLRHTT